jgi:hypothetical protein
MRSKPDLEFLNALIAFDIAEASGIKDEKWKPRSVCKKYGLGFVCFASKIRSVEYDQDVASGAKVTYEERGHTGVFQHQHERDMRTRIGSARLAVACHLEAMGNDHWGTEQDVEVLARKLCVGIVSLPSSQMGDPEHANYQPHLGWVYAVPHTDGANQQAYEVWIIIVCIGASHFRLCGTLRGEEARVSFLSREVPRVVRAEYNANNLHCQMLVD